MSNYIELDFTEPCEQQIKALKFGTYVERQGVSGYVMFKVSSASGKRIMITMGHRYTFGVQHEREYVRGVPLSERPEKCTYEMSFCIGGRGPTPDSEAKYTDEERQVAENFRLLDEAVSQHLSDTEDELRESLSLDAESARKMFLANLEKGDGFLSLTLSQRQVINGKKAIPDPTQGKRLTIPFMQFLKKEVRENNSGKKLVVAGNDINNYDVSTTIYVSDADEPSNPEDLLKKSGSAYPSILFDSVKIGYNRASLVLRLNSCELAPRTNSEPVRMRPKIANTTEFDPQDFSDEEEI